MRVGTDTGTEVVAPHRRGVVEHAHDHHHEGSGEPLPGERVVLHSVGIDIGSATSHVIFSRLTLERQGRALSSRYDVVERQIVHRSPVTLTPYHDAATIDAEALATFVADCYAAAGRIPDEVDTGAVIVTGEAARKVNAERIVAALAAYAGRFVCATAGPVLEGVLAAHGSGALRHSRAVGPLINVDIGGGTSKLSVLREGRVDAVHAVSAGGRLIAWDAAGRLVRLEDAGRRLADLAGVPVALGEVLSDAGVRRIAEVAADLVLDRMGGGEPAAGTGDLSVTPPLGRHDVRLAAFSGGVGAMVNGEPGAYGDLGAPLAAALRSRLAAAGWRTLLPDEAMHATVVGVGQFTVQLSGNTIYTGDPSVLPLRNLRVVTVPRLSPSAADAADVAEAIGRAMTLADRTDGDGPLALALRADRIDTPAALGVLAHGVAAAIPRLLAAGGPVVLLLDEDVAGVLGHRIAEAAAVATTGVVVIDQVEVGELDFIDVGAVHADSGAVPVVVKSLVF